MIIVGKVKSKTLKGGVNAELGPATIIIGRNGSGKSRIVNALELGLTGKVSDIRGRGVVAEAASLKLLGALAAADEDPDASSAAAGGFHLPEAESSGPKRKAPDVELELVNGKLDADGQLVDGATSLKIKAGAKGGSFPDALLLREVEDAVLGSAATLRRFLVRHAVGVLSREDILARLPAEQRAAYTDASAAADASELEDGPPDELSILLGVGSYAAGRARKAGVEAKAATAFAAGAQGTPPTAADLATAAAAVVDATQALEKAAGAQATATARAERKLKLRELHVKIEAILAQRPDLRDVPPPAGAAKPAPFTETFTRNLASLRQHAADGAGKCLVCGTVPADGPDHFKARLAKVEAIILTREYHLLAAQKRELEELFKTPVEDGAFGPEALPTARKLLLEAQAAATALQARQTAWRGVDQARARASESEKTQAKFEALAKACGEVLKNLLAAGRMKFAARVQAGLPRGDIFGLELTETRIDFGLVKDGDLHSALSGAEWVRVLGAMALACRESPITPDGLYSDGATGPRILITPDRAFDAETLADVLEAWRGFPASTGIQIIMTSTIDPARTAALEGWTVVRTSALPTAAAAPARVKQPAPVVDAPLTDL